MAALCVSGWVVAAVLLIVLLLTWRANLGRTRPEFAAGIPPAEAPATAVSAPETLMTVYIRPHSDNFSRGRWIRFWRYEKRADGTVAFAGPEGALIVDSSAVDWPGVKRALE